MSLSIITRTNHVLFFILGIWLLLVEFTFAIPIATWNSTLPSLPTNTLPGSPLVGNGYLGCMLTTEAWAVPFATANGARGPGDDSLFSTHYFINSNGMWDIKQAADAEHLGPTSTGTKIALGGLTITSSLFSADDSSHSFEATQNIEIGMVTDIHRSKCGEIATTTTVHPTLNTMILSTKFLPTPNPDPACTTNPVNFTISLWTFSQMQTQGGGLPPGQKTPLVFATNAGSHFVSRRTGDNSPREVRAVLSAFTDIMDETDSDSEIIVSNSVKLADDSNFISEFKTTISISANRPLAFTTKVALADNVDQSPASTSIDDLTLQALETAKNLNRDNLNRDNRDWWEGFWNASSISLPTQSKIERFYYGAQYILAISSPKNPNSPTPGLFGPFSSWDVNGWNGDYTLDYNFEATFYGAFSSNRPRLTDAYFKAVLDGIPSARKGAQAIIKSWNDFGGNFTGDSCDVALHFNTHIGPFGSGDIDEEWENPWGLKMHWNGLFASLLFMSHYEYTLDEVMLEEKTLPLLRGLISWFECTMSVDDNGLFVDSPDSAAEGQIVSNPIMSLAFLQRAAKFVTDNSEADEFTKSLGEKLSPFQIDATTGAWLNFDGATTDDSNMWANYPIHPGEYYNSFSDTDILQTAQKTSKQYSVLATGRPVEIFPAAVKAGVSDGQDPSVGFTAREIIDGMNAFLDNVMMENLLPFTPAGGIENVGVSRAVNEMLVVGEFWGDDAVVISLFDVWKFTGESATFSNLLTKGNFLVSARFDGKVGETTELKLKSYSGMNVVVVNPFGCDDVIILDGGGKEVDFEVEKTPKGEGLKFKPKIGELYDMISGSSC